MNDPIEINRRNLDERTIIHARDAAGEEALAGFRVGEDALHEIEVAELGDISGKRVLHLQCHVGKDTLCLARRGAVVTGLDFSRPALNFAQRLAAERGLRASFVHGTMDEAPRVAPGPFDLVFATWGALCWQPDLSSWAKVVASVLAPDGELYCADAHPSFLAFPDRPMKFSDPTVMTHHSPGVSIHSLSAIIGAVIEAGLILTSFREHKVLPWRRYAARVATRPGEAIALSGDVVNLVSAPDRMWRLRDDQPLV